MTASSSATSRSNKCENTSPLDSIATVWGCFLNHQVDGYCHTSDLMKSMKVINKEWFHSIHCSMLLRRAKTWSMQPRPLWNPAYSCLNFESMALSILAVNLKRCCASPVFTIILLRSPIFESWIIIRKMLQSLGITSWFQILAKISERTIWV